jgi:hypothetical protein
MGNRSSRFAWYIKECRSRLKGHGLGYHSCLDSGLENFESS